jgi:hypothetical protein
MTFKKSVTLLAVALVVLAAVLVLNRAEGDATESAPVAVGMDQPAAAAVIPAGTEMIVYKSPTCGCCEMWIDHVEAAGFTVVTEDVYDLRPVKAENGITSELASCHTAIVDGYVIEGHVPSDVIARLLEERPDIRGLAVPGMPSGSPGMEGGTPVAYDVVAFDADGNTSVYASIDPVAPEGR